MRIEIAGTLATGKTTLMEAFANSGYELVLEDLSTNRYIELRMQDPEKYRLICAETFVQDKLNQLTSAHASGSKKVVSDFSLSAERAYLEYYQPNEATWLKKMEGRIDECEKLIGKPSLLVVLRCRPEIQLQRIKKRGRDFEQGHDLNFIHSINAILDQKVQDEIAAGVSVLEVNSENWTFDEADAHDVSNIIRRSQHGQSPHALATL